MFIKYKISLVVSVFLIGIISASARVTVLGDLSHEMKAEPGDIYYGDILLSNTGDREEKIQIYQCDYFFYADGTTEYGEPGRIKRSNARWMTWQPEQLTLPPNEQSRVTYKITVPSADTLSGTYWSMLMVEPLIPGKKRSGVQPVFRYGIQIVTHIKNTGQVMIQFSNINNQFDSDTCRVSVDIENTGSLLIKPEVWIEIYNDEQLMNKIPGRHMRIYPGTSVRYHLNAPGMVPGCYQSVIIADCGDENLFGVRHTIKP